MNNIKKLSLMAQVSEDIEKLENFSSILTRKMEANCIASKRKKEELLIHFSTLSQAQIETCYSLKEEYIIMRNNKVYAIRDGVDLLIEGICALDFESYQAWLRSK